MADRIVLLPDHIANQIAAGEVIQRPASAVKELLENAIDAGATDIQLYLRDAGKELIQVIDNGKGMSETIVRDQKNRDKCGVLALQIHSGPPMTVEFRNLQYEKLEPKAKKKNKAKK